MRKLLSNKKGFTITILSLVLITVIVIGGSIAYFTDSDKVMKTFTMGKVKIVLDEPGWSEEDGLGLLPGSVRVKDPTVTAIEGKCYMRICMEITDGDGSLITDTARINLILDTLYYDPLYGTSIPNIKVIEKYLISDIETLLGQNKINKEYNYGAFAFAGIETGKPGVRYYNYIANSGIFDGTKIPADMSVLFSNVVIPKDWNSEEIFILNGDRYETTSNGGIEVTVTGKGYKLILTAEAIQASEMANAAEAFAALDEAVGVTRDTSSI